MLSSYWIQLVKKRCIQTEKTCQEFLIEILSYGMDERKRDDRDLRALKTKLTLRPGQRGTKQLLAQYGDRLVCVRYRYDPQRQTRVKTIELIIEESTWAPKQAKRDRDEIVGINVARTERAIQRRVKAVGGTWNMTRQVWELPYHQVIELGLQDRICHEHQG